MSAVAPPYGAILYQEKLAVDVGTRFRINKPRVVHETIDNEVVLIDFDTGNYYSLDGVGADVWDLVERGATLRQIFEAMACRYDGDHGNVGAAVQQFMAELLRENLIVTGTTEVENTQDLAPGDETGQQVEKPRFRAPFLQKYSDMQELLLLDPIHEVDETGWPGVPPDVPVIDHGK